MAAGQYPGCSGVPVSDSEPGSVEQLRGEDDREGALCVQYKESDDAARYMTCVELYQEVLAQHLHQV